MRISEANRMAEGYMKSTAKTRANAMDMIDNAHSRWIIGSLHEVDPQDADDLKRLLIRMFTAGFTAGCRTALARSKT